jgi:hypothetical protein
MSQTSFKGPTIQLERGWAWFLPLGQNIFFYAARQNISSKFNIILIYRVTKRILVNLVLILYDISNIAEYFLNIGYGINVKDTKRQHRRLPADTIKICKNKLFRS